MWICIRNIWVISLLLEIFVLMCHMFVIQSMNKYTKITLSGA